MAQYIITRVLPATNTKPARIVAETSYGRTRMVVSVDRYGSHETAHIEAARELATVMQWYGKWVEGAGAIGNVYVLCPAAIEGQGFIVGP